MTSKRDRIGTLHVDAFKVLYKWSLALANDGDVRNLEDLFDELQKAARGEHKVSVGEVYEEIGERSFGPLLLAAGLLALTPIGVVPLAPTLLAVIVILIAGQLLIGRAHIWLPKPILKMSVKKERMDKAVRWGARPARVIDRLLKPRLTRLTTGVGSRAIAAVCVIIALAIPPLELVPFGVFAPAGAITLFGLALITRDGVAALIGFTISAVAFGLLAMKFLGGN